jgi:hypothetical protein
MFTKHDSNGYKKTRKLLEKSGHLMAEVLNNFLLVDRFVCTEIVKKFPVCWRKRKDLLEIIRMKLISKFLRISKFLFVQFRDLTIQIERDRQHSFFLSFFYYYIFFCKTKIFVCFFFLVNDFIFLLVGFWILCNTGWLFTLI